MDAALAAFCLLGNKTQHSQVFVAVYFDSKLKLQSISPAKVREKPPDHVENRIMGCGGRENSLHSLRIL